jgi:AP2-associated kinase
MEEEDPAKKREKRSGSGSKQSNRRSMPTISLSGTKSILAGRFGDAFRRFEANTGGPRDTSPPGEKSGPSLTPIAGSEATDERSDDGQVIEEVEQTPEFRRELERRRLSVEERRVAEAAAAYKQQVAERGNDGTHTRGRELNRAAMIQNKVQALLDETNKSSPTKTAEGYGRFTNPPAAPHGGKAEPLEARSTPPISSPRFPPGGTAKPSGTVDLAINRTRQPPGSAAPTPASPIDRSFARPSAPPKPQALRTGGREPLGHVAAKPASLGNRTDQNAPPAGAGAGAVHGDDWETTFSKRYPSLSGLEMVETAIDKSGGVASTRDV